MSTRQRKLRVFLTVDAELWPYKPGWPDVRLTERDRVLDRQFDHCILGRTEQGEFGLRYQMACLNRHGLRANFFVEPLHSAAVGERWLAETVGMILLAGQEVQLHAHTEWLSDADDQGLPHGFKQFMRDYPLEEQARIIAWAKQRLERCGAGRLIAFRAGNFGANSDTLQAVRRAGLAADSSYNRCYATGNRTIDIGQDVFQPRTIEGVTEVPMTVFTDYPGHYRPAQLAACSSWELERALWQARSFNWRSFVILWHGPELLRPGFRPDRRARASAVVLRRFERLCRFLDRNRDKFETPLFSEVAPTDLLADDLLPRLTSNLFLTAHRVAQQAIGRFV
jgi:peptidoglycan/xylan/chitin deacetylase (PgdA/CDA1 family)